MRKKVYIILLALLCAFNVVAQTLFVSDSGIEYRITSSLDKTVQVAYGNCSGDIVIPSRVLYEGYYYDVTSIGDNAFYCCYGLTGITIPGSVTSIGDYAFNICDGLISITMSEGVTSIGDYAFSGCEGLTSITLPGSVTNIGDNAFSDCEGLTSITLPGVTIIGDNAFSGCVNLTSITLPGSVTSIGSSAFLYCSDLSYVIILSSIPPTCTNNTFPGTYPLYVVEGLVQEYQTATDWNNYAERIREIPVIQPGDSHPNNEIWYTSSDGNAITPYGKFWGTNIVSNVYENGRGVLTFDFPVTSIDNWAFCYCYGLTSISIPESVTSIGADAFSDCYSLTSIAIPESVTYMGDLTFRNCVYLERVTIYSSGIIFGDDVFAGNASGRKIYVFQDLLDEYKNNLLSDYSEDIEPIPDLVANDAGDGSGRWCTYYNGMADVRVADGTTIYKAAHTQSGSVTLTEIPGNIVKRGEAVLLNTTVSNIGQYSGTWNGGVNDYDGNELKGVDYSTPQADGVACYVLSKVNDVFGFYKLRENVNLGANKAYLVVNNSSQVQPRSFYSIGGGNEGEETIAASVNKEIETAEWFTIYGQKLDGEPVESGLYILNGQKVLIK